MATIPKPKAVLISDIHFTAQTLDLALSALRQAMNKATELGVPAIIAGDTLDGKALIRGECANALLSEFKHARASIIILVGNHDRLNERDPAHSLNFLKAYSVVIDRVTIPFHDRPSDLWLIPYHSDPEEFKRQMSRIPEGSTIVCHQGVHGANMGHYVLDKTALPKEVFANHRVISGHYHRRQNIKCGRPRKGSVGLFSYIGNPYTISFGEANDPEKGFQILMDDGTLEFIPVNLRKHVIIETQFNELDLGIDALPDDIIWLKVKGSHTELEKLDKKAIGMQLLGHTNFKLENIYTDAPNTGELDKLLSNSDLMDVLIDGTNESIASKQLLKLLWREVYEIN